ncbi:MAG: hypothetical protein H7X71_00450 [Chitinophagales bacterium]|nr:hypothetical protein [Chitinophagales bacterium]
MKKIIFVYNADAGKLNALWDTMHKIFSPSTYPCNLCAITFGNFAIRKEWEEFINQLQTQIIFLHKDEFAEQYPKNKTAFPVAFQVEADGLVEFISPAEMKVITLAELKQLLIERLPV